MSGIIIAWILRLPRPRELLSLLRLRQRTRSSPPHRNPRTHRALRRPL